MTKLSRLSRFLYSSAAAALVLGASLAPGPTQARVVIGHPGQVVNPQRQGGCLGHGGVKVTPCQVTFTSSNPGPVTITVTTPGGGTLALSQKSCSVSGVASITSQGSGQYLVTAGSSTGVCYGHFRYYDSQGKRVGHAAVTVTNQL